MIFFRGVVQNILSPEPLNFYYTTVQWATVTPMLILQCILCLQIQSIDFTNASSWSDIPSGEPVFIELPMGFNNDGGKCDYVLRFKKIIYGQAEAACLWYEKLRSVF